MDGDPEFNKVFCREYRLLSKIDEINLWKRIRSGKETSPRTAEIFALDYWLYV